VKFIPSQPVAGAGIAALSAAGLFAVAPHAQKTTTTPPKFLSRIETVLGMTPSQKDGTQTAFAQARQAALPIRQELMNRRKSLEAAIRSDDRAQIQRLATVEGQEIGQLAAIRSTAAATLYKTLTPDQKAKATALQHLLMPEHMRAAS
jgi:LTXXQ motif family protein